MFAGGGMVCFESAGEALESLVAHFSPEAAGDGDCVFSFNLSGAGGGTFAVYIENGRCRLTRDRPPRHDIEVCMSTTDYLDLVSRELNPQVAYLTGKLVLRGNMKWAQRAEALFSGALALEQETPE